MPLLIFSREGPPASTIGVLENTGVLDILGVSKPVFKEGVNFKGVDPAVSFVFLGGGGGACPDDGVEDENVPIHNCVCLYLRTCVDNRCITFEILLLLSTRVFGVVSINSPTQPALSFQK